MRHPLIPLVTIVAGTAYFALAGSATGSTSQPAHILPQHQQALLYFGVYQVAADQLAADQIIPGDLRQKLTDRIASGRTDADAMLAKASPPADGAAGVQESARLGQQVSQLTRACVGDIRQLLGHDQYQAFDDRARITMEEVLSLQVVKPDTDYVRRDVLDLLDLSSEQRRRVDALLRSCHQRMAQIPKQHPYRINDGRGPYLSTELAFETRHSLRGMLTADQLKRWDDEILNRVGGKQVR